MSEGRFILWSDKIREAACRAIMAAEKDSRVTIDAPKRTLDQNAKLHAMIRDVMTQHPVTFDGEKLGEHGWKQALLEALGHKTQWIYNPFNDRIIGIAPSTSGMRVAQCADAIEQLYQFGAEHNVVWSEPEIWHQGRSA